MPQFEATHAALAPPAFAIYSHAVRARDTLYVSGQIPLDPVTMEFVDGSIEQQITRAFLNLQTIPEAAGGRPTDVVKSTVYVTDLAYLSVVNNVMEKSFEVAYPARAAVGVSQFTKGVGIKIDAILELGGR